MLKQVGTYSWMMVFVALFGCPGDDASTDDVETDATQSVSSCEEITSATTPQYHCDGRSTTGLCIDHYAGFDPDFSDEICADYEATAVLDSTCDLTEVLGACCKVAGELVKIERYYAGTSLTIEQLQDSCEVIGFGTWIP